MKNAIKGLFSIVMLFSMTADAANQNGTSFLLGGNIGNIAGGGLIEEAGRTHRHDAGELYGCFSTHFEFNKSTKGSDLGQFFSPIASDTFRVGKTNNGTAGNTTTDVWNVFFLLEEDYEADIKLKPVSTTFTTNLGLFVGLDEFYEGLWFDVNLPIVYNKREVKITETVVTAKTNTTYPVDFFSDNTNDTVVSETFKASMVGDKAVAVGTIAGNMKYGQINGSQNTTKVGNVTAALGYDFINKENCHLGAGLSALINGNGKSDAVYMFEPSVGTGGRHGVGARVDGHIRAYEKDDCEINFFLKANVHALFNTTEKRTYDLVATHGIWSRYILARQFAAIAGDATANGQVHIGNISTLNAKVGMAAMYDVNLMAAYSNGALGINLGYGLSGHSAEKHKGWVDTFTTAPFGASALDVADFDTTGATDSFASGDVHIDGGNGSDAVATAAANTAALNLALEDLDVNSAMSPNALVNNVYADVNYRWEDSEWEPNVGVGGGASFANGNKSISQWGVHFHGGICF